MSPPELTALKTAVAIRPELVVKQQTTLRIRQHGKGLQSGNFSIFQQPLDQANTDMPRPILSVDGKYGSFDEKRTFRDASGQPLFELYHKPTGVTWYIEVPGSGDTAIARMAPNFSYFKDDMDVNVRLPGVEGGEVRLQVRGKDIWKLRTNVYLGEKVVMTAKRTDKLSTYLPRRKVAWDVEIAAGMDVALASAIVVVMAARMYGSSMQASFSSYQ